MAAGPLGSAVWAAATHAARKRTDALITDQLPLRAPFLREKNGRRPEAAPVSIRCLPG